jgi:hypothetical protein
MAITYKGLATTFLIPGVAAANHILFTIFNTDAVVKAGVEVLVFSHDDSAAATAVSPIIRTSRITTAPTGGTALTKVSRDTTLTTDADIVLRGGASADGTASTITSTPGTGGWGQFRPRGHTMVGQFLMPQMPLIPPLCATDPLILGQNEGLNVAMITAGVTTARYAINVAWQEIT